MFNNASVTVVSSAAVRVLLLLVEVDAMGPVAVD
jgi:hypothetical protein